MTREAQALSLQPPIPLPHFDNDVEFSASSRHSADYLLGSKINVPSDLLLLSVGIIFKTDGYSANVGIYSDVGGHPGDLLATTNQFAVVSTGDVETPVISPLVLPAGDYWFQAVYSADASVGILEGTGAQVDYASHEFSNPLPTVGGWGTYNDQEFKYYLVGVAAVVPEPSTFVLLGSGLIGVVMFARRRRKRS